MHDSSVPRDPDVEKRYRDEAEFFDRCATRAMEGKRSYRLTNTKTHAELFQAIPQLRPVVSFFGDIRGKRVLDLACGNGWVSLYFARSGAETHCCDISPKSIELARRYAEANGLSGNMHPEVMSAEELHYDDEFFDMIFVNAALHHCDIPIATEEILRVLRPGGKAAIIEDLGYHPVLWLYRLFSDSKHTENERPLYVEDVERIRSRFSRSELHYTGLLDCVDHRNPVTRLFSVIDRGLLALPFLRRFSRIVGIMAVK